MVEARQCSRICWAEAGLIVGAAGILILPIVSGQFDLVWMPVVASLTVLGTSVLTVTNLLDYIFIAQRAAHHVVSRSFLFSAAKLILLVALPTVFAAHGVVAVVASWVIGAAATSIVTLVILIPRLGRSHRWTPRGICGEMRKLIRYLILNHVISLSAVLIPTIMPILVVARVSAVENAYFYIAWLVSNLLLTVFTAVSGTLLAEGSYNPDRLFDQVSQAIVLISVLLIVPVFVLTIAGHSLLSLFGSSYSTHAYVPLLLFLVVVAPDAITNVYITILRVRGQHHIGAIVNIAMSVVALGLAWVLLPHMGVTAAGWSWAAGQVVGVGIMVLMTVGGFVSRRAYLRRIG